MSMLETSFAAFEKFSSKSKVKQDSFISKIVSLELGKRGSCLVFVQPEKAENYCFRNLDPRKYGSMCTCFIEKINLYSCEQTTIICSTLSFSEVF